MVRPTVTTLIACKNHGKYLRRAIDSCINQTLRPTDVILINDGSNDDTAKVMKEVKDNYPNVRVFSHSFSTGNIRSYNEGIEKAKGNYFHLMAADDVMEDTSFYEQSVLAMLGDPSIAFSSIGLEWMDDNGKKMGVIATPPFEGRKESLDVLRELYSRGNFINGGGTLIQTAIQRNIGGYDGRLPLSADYLNWIRVLKKGHAAHFIKEAGYLYRRHHGQMTYGKSAPNPEREICKRELEDAILECSGGKVGKLTGTTAAA